MGSAWRPNRHPASMSLAWVIDTYRFALLRLASAMDSVVSPATAIAIGRLGGLGVINLEGLWTRYDDPEPVLAELAGLDNAAVAARLRELYQVPIRPELIGKRIGEIRDAGVVTAASLTPQRTQRLHRAVIEAGVDLFVIQGTVVSAEHVSSRSEPLNLKKFI